MSAPQGVRQKAAELQSRCVKKTSLFSTALPQPAHPNCLQHPCGRDSDGPRWSLSLVHLVAGRTGQACVGQTWHQEPDLGAWKGSERGSVEREVKLRMASCWDPLEPGRRLRSTVTLLRLKGKAGPWEPLLPRQLCRRGRQGSPPHPLGNRGFAAF